MAKVLLRLPDALHAAICRMAAAEDRSAAATYRRIIRAAVAGYLPEVPAEVPAENPAQKSLDEIINIAACTPPAGSPFGPPAEEDDL